jgi:hypothetical protein
VTVKIVEKDVCLGDWEFVIADGGIFVGSGIYVYWKVKFEDDGSLKINKEIEKKTGARVPVKSPTEKLRGGSSKKYPTNDKGEPWLVAATLPLWEKGCENAPEYDIPTALSSAEGKKQLREAVEDPEWLRHPAGDDLAIARLSITDTHKVNCLHYNVAIAQSDIRSYNIGHGDDVFIVGRFVNHEGRQQNRPTVRFGAIAQMPGEVIKFPDGTQQDSFLVEARSIAGFSGSPVFLNRRASQSPYRVSLLGIDHCHLSSPEPIWSSVTKQPNPQLYVKNNTGMMGVVPAWRLTEMLGMDEVQEMIAQKRGEG